MLLLSVLLTARISHASIKLHPERATITPAPDLLKRTLALPQSRVCGSYQIEGGAALVACADPPATCSNLEDNYFGCCTGSSCTYFTTCVDLSSSSPVSTFYGEPWECLEGNRCTECIDPPNTLCAQYLLRESFGATKTLTSYGCLPEFSTLDVYVTLSGTPPDMSTMSKLPGETEVVSCMPSTLDSYPGPTCPSNTQLFLPLILSNLVSLAVYILVGHRTTRARLRFWKKDDADSEGQRFSPLAGFARVAVVGAQAVATAVLIRAGGYEASFGILVAVWLLRPRMMWTLPCIAYFDVVNYYDAMIEGVFADLILNVVTIPILSTFIVQWNKNPDVCGPNPSASLKKWNDYTNYNDLGPIHQLMFGDSDSAVWLARLTCMFLALAVISVFTLARFLLRLSLSPGSLVVTFLDSAAIFAVSWAFWIYFIQFMAGGFCIANLTAITAIHAVAPVFSSILSAWLSHA